MESLDSQIISLLAADGRMSYTDIGKHTRLSTSAAQQRVRRLEQRGIITGYRAVIDSEKIDRELSAFIMIRPMDTSEDADMSAALSEYEELVSCYSVAGDASYILLAQVGSPRELEDLLNSLRNNLSVATRTTLVLSVPFEDRLPPLDGVTEESDS